MVGGVPWTTAGVSGVERLVYFSIDFGGRRGKGRGGRGILCRNLGACGRLMIAVNRWLLAQVTPRAWEREGVCSSWSSTPPSCLNEESARSHWHYHCSQGLWLVTLLPGAWNVGAGIHLLNLVLLEQCCNGLKSAQHLVLCLTSLGFTGQWYFSQKSQVGSRVQSITTPTWSVWVAGLRGRADKVCREGCGGESWRMPPALQCGREESFECGYHRR